MANLSESFGKQIRELRKGQGLTQERLGERADLHPTYIGAIERGEQSPSLETVEKLSAGLGVDLKILFNFKVVPAKSQTTNTLKSRLTQMLLGRSEPELKLGLMLLEDAFRWAKESHRRTKTG